MPPNRALRNALALAAVAAIAAGCGSGDDSVSTGSTQADDSGRAGAPAGAEAQICGRVLGGVQVTASGFPCGEAMQVIADWHKDSNCFTPENASRTSCTLGAYTCQAAAAEGAYWAVNCAAEGRLVAFRSPKP